MTILIKKLEECPQFLAGDRTHLREILHPRNDRASTQYSIAYASLPAGEASLPHALASSEVYYILSGGGIIHVNEEEAAVGPGDAVYIPPGAVQSIRNISNTTLAFLCIVEPAWREEDEVVLTSPEQAKD
jgi:mannose-6-phosphate isomerase-like protein (cupin superfamily)